MARQVKVAKVLDAQTYSQVKMEKGIKEVIGGFLQPIKDFFNTLFGRNPQAVAAQYNDLAKRIEQRLSEGGLGGLVVEAEVDTTPIIEAVEKVMDDLVGLKEYLENLKGGQQGGQQGAAGPSPTFPDKIETNVVVSISTIGETWDLKIPVSVDLSKLKESFNKLRDGLSQKVKDANFNKILASRITSFITQLHATITQQINAQVNLQSENVRNAMRSIGDEITETLREIALKVVEEMKSQQREGTYFSPREAFWEALDIRMLENELKRFGPQVRERLITSLISPLVTKKLKEALRDVTIALRGRLSELGVKVTLGEVKESEEESPQAPEEVEEEEKVKVVDEFIEFLRTVKNVMSQSRDVDSLRDFLTLLRDALQNRDSLYDALSLVVSRWRDTYPKKELEDFIGKYGKVLVGVSSSEVLGVLTSEFGSYLGGQATRKLMKQIKVKPPKKPKPIKKLPPLPKAVEQILLWWKNLPQDSRRVISGILHSYLTETNPDVRKVLERELVETAKKLGIPIKALRELSSE